jgi:hypothetical protein
MVRNSIAVESTPCTLDGDVDGGLIRQFGALGGAGRLLLLRRRRAGAVLGRRRRQAAAGADIVAEPRADLAHLLLIGLGHHALRPVDRRVEASAAEGLHKGDALPDHDRHGDRDHQDQAESRRSHERAHGRGPRHVESAAQARDQRLDQVRESKGDQQRHGHRPHGVAGVQDQHQQRDHHRVPHPLNLPEMQA